MKATHQILARGGVYTCFTPDRCIDHRHQGGRNLDELDPPHIGRGDESGDVADDPSAEGDYGRVAPESGSEQGIGDFPPRLAGLLRLAGRDGYDIYCIGSEAGSDYIAVQLANVLIGYERVPMGGRERRDQLADFFYQADLDLDFRIAGAAREKVYQTSSPFPAMLLARRARVKSKSESRLR